MKSIEHKWAESIIKNNLVRSTEKEIDDMLELFVGHDTRYHKDYTETLRISIFVKNNGIEIVEKKVDRKMLDISEEEQKKVRCICGPQQFGKYIISKILKEEGYVVEGYEMNWWDVRATKNDIVVDCEVGHCRINKLFEVIDEDTHFWLYPENGSYYIFKLGKNFNKLNKLLITPEEYRRLMFIERVENFEYK